VLVSSSPGPLFALVQASHWGTSVFALFEWQTQLRAASPLSVRSGQISCTSKRTTVMCLLGVRRWQFCCREYTSVQTGWHSEGMSLMLMSVLDWAVARATRAETRVSFSKSISAC
jgi:hypothetical protein